MNEDFAIVETKPELATVDPHNFTWIHVSEEGRTYFFDYADTTTPVNEDTVLASSFMAGRWLAR